MQDGAAESKFLAMKDKIGALFVFFALRGRCDLVGSEDFS